MSAFSPHVWPLAAFLSVIALASLCSRLARHQAYHVHRKRMRSLQALGQAFADSAHADLKRESGASLRGAGLKQPAAEVAQQQWDRANRPRAKRKIYEEPKVRWDEILPLIPV